MKLTKVIDILGWYSDSVNGVEDEVKEARKQVKEWKEDAEKWRGWTEFRKTHYEPLYAEKMNKALGDVEGNYEIVEHLKKRVEELRYELDHTNPDYKRSIALQEHLQEMVNLIGFEKYEEIMVGKK